MAQLADTSNLGLELRQVAGLSAGGSISLPPGIYDFHPALGEYGGRIPDPTMKPFRIHISAENVATVGAPGPGIRLDGQPVSQMVPVGRKVIDAGSSRFVVAPARSNNRRRRTSSSAANEAAAVVVERPVEKIVVGNYLEDLPETGERRSGKKGRRFGTKKAEAVGGPDLLLTKMLEVRSAAVEQRRALHPDADELIARAKSGEGHVGKVEPGSKNFGVMSIAYGDLDWKAPFDRPDRIPGSVMAKLEPLMMLPSVPLLADLSAGPFGIVGERQACLSVVRHIMVALRVLSPPTAFEPAVLAKAGTGFEDWAWVDQFPRGQRNVTPALPLLIIDGVAQLGAHNLRPTLTEPGHVGALIIDDQLSELPSVCSHVMEITASGTVTMLDFKRGNTTTRKATPCGISLTDTLEVAENLRATWGQ